MASDERPLRDRKKQKTRATIQRHALRLFREQGYEATTVSQIAHAAEISESTFFRYFPTKEALVVWDELDPLVIEALLAQPAELSPIAALRSALREVLRQLSPEEAAELRQRASLAMTLQPIRRAGADQVSQPLRLLAEAIARRTSRDPDELAVRALVGAALGACVAALYGPEAEQDLASQLDQALAQLEAGFPL